MNLSDIFGSILTIVIGAGVLWWLWQGLVGTWYLIKYLVYKRFWLNTTILIILILIFGWNVLPILLAIAICLGPITKSIALNLWKNVILRK